jgi:D-glycero-D-manno-heptose 1,7-bisphosphate phosphatase
MIITRSRPLRRAVFLDRDGVLNEALIRNGKPVGPTQLAELRIPPGTAEALARLKERDFLLLVVTNQPGVARGVQKRDTVEQMTRRLRAELPLDDVLTCFHDDHDNCDCRKPRPGLVTRAAQQYGIDLGRSYLIGDRWRDVDAGSNAGCKTIWIDHGYVEQAPASAPDARVGSLPEAVDWILGEPSRETSLT